MRELSRRLRTRLVNPGMRTVEQVLQIVRLNEGSLELSQLGTPRPRQVQLELIMHRHPPRRLHTASRQIG